MEYRVLQILHYNILNFFDVCCNILFIYDYVNLAPSLFLLVSLAKLCQSVYLLKELVFRFIDPLYCFLCFYFIDFCPFFIISCIWLGLDKVFLVFPDFLSCIIQPSSCSFPYFLMWGLRPINLPCRTHFNIFKRFCCVVFSFLFFQNIFILIWFLLYLFII